MLKPLLIGFAWFSVGFGLLAAVIPLVPTTPFVLLGLAIFAKQDPRSARRVKVLIARARARWTR